MTTYGEENKDVLIFLHGGGLSWWNYRDAAEMLKTDYHVILPILDGHASSDHDFTSIEDNAARLIALIDARFGGSVLLIGGLSLGGQILLEMLSQRGDICQHALIESALAIPSGFTHALIKPAFGSCHGLIRRRWFSLLQFRSLRLKPALFQDYYRDTCGIAKANMISFLQANALYSIKDSIENCAAGVHIFVGAKENHAMRCSAEIIQRRLRGSRLQVLPRLHHGEFSINHADRYAATVLEIIATR